MRATKQIFSFFYQLQKVPNCISSVFLKIKHHKKYQKKTDCLKTKELQGFMCTWLLWEYQLLNPDLIPLRLIYSISVPKVLIKQEFCEANVF